MILNCKNISQYYSFFFCIFDQKMQPWWAEEAYFKSLTDPKFFNGSVYTHTHTHTHTHINTYIIM